MLAMRAGLAAGSARAHCGQRAGRPFAASRPHAAARRRSLAGAAAGAMQTDRRVGTFDDIRIWDPSILCAETSLTRLRFDPIIPDPTYFHSRLDNGLQGKAVSQHRIGLALLPGFGAGHARLAAPRRRPGCAARPAGCRCELGARARRSARSCQPPRPTGAGVLLAAPTAGA